MNFSLELLLNIECLILYAILTTININFTVKWMLLFVEIILNLYFCLVNKDTAKFIY